MADMTIPLKPRAELVRTAVVELLTRSTVPLCTQQISDVVRTPHHLFRTVPRREFIVHTDIYAALRVLERRGIVARLPRVGARDPVWWRLVSAVEQEVTQPVELPPEVEPVDLDALQRDWAHAGGT